MINVSSRLVISNIGGTRYKKSKNKTPKARSALRRVIIRKTVEIIKEEVWAKKGYQSRWEKLTPHPPVEFKKIIIVAAIIILII